MTWFTFAALCFAGLIVLAGIGLFFVIVTFRTGQDDGPPDNHHEPPLRDANGKPLMPPNQIARAGSEKTRPCTCNDCRNVPPEARGPK